MEATKIDGYEMGDCGLQHSPKHKCALCAAQLDGIMKPVVEERTLAVDEEIALLEPMEGGFSLDDDGNPIEVDAALEGGFSTFDVEVEPTTVALTGEERDQAIDRLDKMGMHSIADEL